MPTIREVGVWLWHLISGQESKINDTLLIWMLAFNANFYEKNVNSFVHQKKKKSQVWPPCRWFSCSICGKPEEDHKFETCTGLRTSVTFLSFLAR
jgi:hypothetical protein